MVFTRETLRDAKIQQAQAVKLINLAVGESAQRRAQHAHECEPVVRVVDRAQQVHCIDDFLDGIEMPFALDHVGDAASAQRLEVVVDIGQFSQQYRDIPGLNGARFSFSIRNHRLAQRFFLEPAGQTLGLEPARPLAVELVVAAANFSHGYLAEGESISFLVAVARGRGADRDILGLQACSRPDQPVENSVDDVENFSMAAEVGRKPAFDAVLRYDDFLHDFQIGFDVGAAKRVDRLLRIADHEDFSLGELNVFPVGRLHSDLLGKVDEDFILDGIGVLEFIDQDRLEAALQLLAHRPMIAHESSRAREQAVEGDQSSAGKRLAKMLRERDEQPAQLSRQSILHPAERSGDADDLLRLAVIFLRPSLERFVETARERIAPGFKNPGAAGSARAEEFLYDRMSGADELFVAPRFRVPL